MGKVTAILLIWALVATGFAWSQWLKVKDLQRQLQNELEEAKYYENETNALLKKCDLLEERIRELKNENANLTLQIELLKNRRNTEIQQLRDQIDDLKSYVKYLEQKIKLYEQVPHGYYSTNFFPKYPNTVKGLKDFLAHLKIPHKYERGVFDCSEISAYVEWALENAGFDAYIVLGKEHAWDMVKLDGFVYYVDASSGKPLLFKKLPDDPDYKIVKIFKNIYEAVDYYGNVSEWDWWNVVGFPPKI